MSAAIVVQVEAVVLASRFALNHYVISFSNFKEFLIMFESCFVLVSSIMGDTGGCKQPESKPQ